MVKRLLHPRLLAPVLAGLIAGAVLAPFQLSCGVVEHTACAADQCPAGPAGPAGPTGPAGPAGPTSFHSCQWLYSACAAGAGVECPQICPTGTHPVSGSCDAEGNASLSENRASTGATTFPSSPAPFTAFDRWVCQTAIGNMQFTYALCCAL